MRTMASRILSYPNSIPARVVAGKVGSTEGAVRVVRWKARHPEKAREAARRYYKKWLRKPEDDREGMNDTV